MSAVKALSGIGQGAMLTRGMSMLTRCVNMALGIGLEAVEEYNAGFCEHLWRVSVGAITCFSLRWDIRRLKAQATIYSAMEQISSSLSTRL